MRPNIVIFKVLSKACLFFIISLSGFYASAQILPTADQLFLRGQFLIKRGAPWRENHYGEAMDLSVRRPVVNISNTLFATKYGKPGTTLYANLYHRGRFFIARIPNDGVQNVYFQLAYFPPKIWDSYIAAHSLLRLQMNPLTPIELVAEMPTESDLESWQQSSTEEILAKLPEAAMETLLNVAISAEASWTLNDPKKSYDLVRGKLGAYLQVVRLVSMEERLVDFYKNGNPVSQYKVDLGGDLNRVMTVGLQMSQHDGLSKIYDTLFYNCTTMAFDIVEAAFQLKDNRLGFIRSFTERRIPLVAPIKIEYYGGIEATPLELDPSLKDEAHAACARTNCAVSTTLKK